jgi:hypothetical protein
MTQKGVRKQRGNYSHGFFFMAVKDGIPLCPVIFFPRFIPLV